MVLSRKINQYRIVNSSIGKMTIDFVLDPASSHIPCDDNGTPTETRKAEKKKTNYVLQGNRGLVAESGRHRFRKI